MYDIFMPEMFSTLGVVATSTALLVGAGIAAAGGIASAAIGAASKPKALPQLPTPPVIAAASKVAAEDKRRTAALKTKPILTSPAGDTSLANVGQKSLLGG